MGGPALASGRTAAVHAACVIVGAAVALWMWFRRPAHSRAGQWSIGLLAGFVALSAVSISWSVDPMATWDEVNRLMAYFAVFGAAVIAARAVPDRWRVVLLGLALAAVGMSVLAMGSKMFPGLLAPREQFARLREPLEYWNAIGVIGAFGLPLWLYFGTRRQGRPILDILAAPAITLLLVTVLLAYSRGALLAVVIGLAFWLALVPRRLKTVAVLIPALLGTAVIILWAFGQPDLTRDGVSLVARETAGRRFAGVVAITTVFVGLGSLAVQFLLAARPPGASLRRRAGMLLIAGAVLLGVAGLAALGQSQKGLSGTVSEAWTQITDPAANSVSGSAPANDPARLAALNTPRSIYWRDAIRVFRDHEWFGSGAAGYGTARLKVRDEPFEVEHAHGYVVQVLADLGIAGLLLTLALFGAWIAAAVRTLRRATAPQTEERVALLAITTAVIIYGAHSTIDWTWSFPAATIPALIAAGWIVGRGPTRPATSRVVAPATTVRARLVRYAPAAGVILAAGVSVWSIQEPYRGFQATQQTLAAIAEGRTADAIRLGQTAVDRVPVAIDASSSFAIALASGGDVSGGREVLMRAIARQPQNPAAWRALLEYELGPAADAQRAAAAYRAALFLDPQSISLRRTIEQALAPAVPAAPAAPAPSVPAPTPQASAEPVAPSTPDAESLGDVAP